MTDLETRLVERLAPAAAPPREMPPGTGARVAARRVGKAGIVVAGLAAFVVAVALAVPHGRHPVPGGSNAPPTPASRRDAGVFQLRPVLKMTSPSDPGYANLKPVCATDGGCPGIRLPAPEGITAQGPDGNRYTLGPAFVTTRDVVWARAAYVPTSPRSSWVVNFQLSAGGTRALARATTLASQHFSGGPSSPRSWIAIVVDGVVVSAPAVDVPATSGAGQISGTLTKESATALANSMGGPSQQTSDPPVPAASP